MSQPKKLEDVLKLTAAHTKTDTSSEETSYQPMTEERRQFLQNTLAAVNREGPIQRVNIILAKLHKYITENTGNLSDDSSDEIETLYEELEELVDWCDDLDLACDFHKIGGFSIFTLLQDSQNEGLKWRCGDLIATLCQNNPYCQEKLLAETDQLDRLMQMVKSGTESPLVKVKAMYALSCFLGGFNEGQDIFVKKDGYLLVFQAMQSGSNHKLQTKAAFFLSKLMKDGDKHKKNLTDLGCVEKLLAMVKQPHAPHHEHVFYALLELVTDFPAAIKVAQQPTLHMQSFLLDRQSFLQTNADAMEELALVVQLLQTIFPH